MRGDSIVVTGLTDRLKARTEVMQFGHADVARLVGTSARTVSRWINGEVQPRRAARERLLEVVAVLERLSQVLRPEPARDWLFSPNPTLGHENPPISCPMAGTEKFLL